MAEKFRVNTDPDQAGVRRDMTAETSERSRAGLLIPAVVALMGLTLFLVLFARFNPNNTGNVASNLAANQSAAQRQVQDNGPAARPNGPVQPER